MKQLRTIPTRVYRAEDSTTTDAQRITQMGFTRTNDAIEAVNGLRSSPFGNGQMLTVPDGTGGRSETVTLSAGLNTFPHDLGTPVQGFILVDFLTSIAGSASGSWHDTTTQTAAATNTAYPISLNSTDFQSGCARDGSGQFITVNKSGTYNLQFSAQVDKTSGSLGRLWLWPRVNGVDVPNSASQVNIHGNDDAKVIAWNWMLKLADAASVSLMWATDSTSVIIRSIASAAPVPDIPSVIVTLESVDNNCTVSRKYQSRSEEEKTIVLYSTHDAGAKIWVW